MYLYPIKLSIMKKTIFVISDLHLGGAPESDGKRSFQMCSLAGQARLAEFIRYVADQRSRDREIHLVLNGDIVDFLAEEEFAPFTEKDEIAGEKLGHIFQRTEDVWESLEAYVRSGAKLTLLLGNHDIELSLPTPRRLLLNRLGPGRIEFIYDNQAFVEGPVLIEHGNRYDSWNIISHDNLREVRSAMSRGESPPKFESPAGSQLVFKVMNKIKAKYPFVDLLKPEDAALLPLLAVLEPQLLKNEWNNIIPLWRKQHQIQFDGQGVPADLANIAAPVAARNEQMLNLAQQLAQTEDEANIGFIEDVKSFWELWRLAASRNEKDLQLERLYKALHARAEATWQAFDVNREIEQVLRPARAAANRGFKVVVFGHTHLVKRVSLNDQGAVYLNTGTWADLMQVPEAVLSGDEAEAKWKLEQFANDLATNRLENWRRQVPTFVKIELGSNQCLANVYRFNGPGDIAKVQNGRLSELAC